MATNKRSSLFNTETLSKVSVHLKKKDISILNEIAREERRSKSSLIREAIEIYLTNSITDKDLIYSSLNDSKRKLEYLDQKVETFFNLWFYSLTSTFAGLPDMSLYPKDKQEMITKTAVKRKNAMLEKFKKTILEQPSLFQSLLADFFEHENEEDK